MCNLLHLGRRDVTQLLPDFDSLATLHREIERFGASKINTIVLPRQKPPISCPAVDGLVICAWGRGTAANVGAKGLGRRNINDREGW